jgi:ribonuclease HI
VVKAYGSYHKHLNINTQDNSLSPNVGTSICLYTDGSCHTQLKKGAWASIVLIRDEKIILEGIATNTTHQRMELTAVIKALRYLKDNNLTNEKIIVCTDSQYVADLLKRKERFIRLNYLTKNLKPIRNADLVKDLIELMEPLSIHFVKVKAHQKSLTIGTRFNREVDLLVRKKMRSDGYQGGTTDSTVIIK